MRVGFLGLGTMGTPMALNLARKFDLTVWNRSPARYAPFHKQGIKIRESASQVVQESDFIFMMLFDGAAVESLIDDDFKAAVRGKTVINTSSIPTECSQKVAAEVASAGGEYIEMPVSGSKIPAEQGTLVGMIAGDPDAAERIRPVVEPITSSAVYCGDIGQGLRTKYAVNLYLLTMTAGLAESMKLAQAQGLNLEAVGEVLNAGPMASAHSKMKIAKIVNDDWSPQAAIKDCYNSTILMKSAAQMLGTRLPLIELCSSLYKEALENGQGGEDMVSVFKVIGRQQE